MAEYALMVLGEVEMIVNSNRPVDELRGYYPGYAILPVDQVPIATLERYEYWVKRS